MASLHPVIVAFGRKKQAAKVNLSDAVKIRSDLSLELTSELDTTEMKMFAKRRVGFDTLNSFCASAQTRRITTTVRRKLF